MVETQTRWVLTLSCVDGPGIVHAVSGAVVAAGGNIDESQQSMSPDTGLFFMRLQVEAVASEEPSRHASPNPTPPGPRRYNMTWRLDVVGRPVRTLLLASTATHCVNDLLYRQRSGHLPIDVPLILSNHETVRDIADFYGIPFEHRAIAGPDDKADFEARVLEVVAEHRIELVVLARYMQILSPELCEALAGMAINIHHSFLPGFKGANPYRQAHARGVKLIGATAHFVTTDLDEGPIIEQDVVRVDHSHSPEQLQQLGQDEEARTLRRAVDHADGWETSLSAPDDLRWRLEYLREYAASTGRDPAAFATHLYHNININEDRQAALDESKRFLDIYYTMDYAPDFVDSWTATGSPEECAAHLRVFQEMGFDEVTLRVAGWDQFGQLDRLITEVLPLLDA